MLPAAPVSNDPPMMTGPLPSGMAISYGASDEVAPFGA